MKRWEQAGYADIVRAAAPHWSTVRVAGDGDYVEILTDGEPLAVPWDAIRTLTDRAFAQHRLEFAREESRRIGRRIRELREARRLTAKQLAATVGMTPQSISRIERGQHDVTFATLREILAAMDCSLRDLIQPREEDEAANTVSAGVRRSSG